MFGTKSDRDIKTVMPYVDLVNAEYKKINGVSDDELRGLTGELKDVINRDLKHIDDQVKANNDKLDNNPKMDVTLKETGVRSQIVEVGLYTVTNGKIVQEEFLYHAG